MEGRDIEKRTKDHDVGPCSLEIKQKEGASKKD
jgi:hypothetical protein